MKAWCYVCCCEVRRAAATCQAVRLLDVAGSVWGVQLCGLRRRGMRFMNGGLQHLGGISVERMRGCVGDCGSRTFFVPSMQ